MLYELQVFTSSGWDCIEWDTDSAPLIDIAQESNLRDEKLYRVVGIVFEIVED